MITRFLTILLTFFLAMLNVSIPVQAAVNNPHPWWEVQSIDTMKFSRDPSRQYLARPDRGAALIEPQVLEIAKTGATHVAIATPYDEEFLPVLEQWVASARRHNLHVWFRGNWSGWEGWFEYPRISRDQHLKKTQEFILDNKSLFQEGDIFTGCPECENGGPGDPRLNGDTLGHRNFLIEEQRISAAAFTKIGKRVRVNFNSMNGDVARLIMDRVTTKALGNLVVVDHYVRTPEQLAQDVLRYAQSSQANVALGEFGVPIPDLNGRMTDEEQALWLGQALSQLALLPELTGVNYWTSRGGSTALWSDSGEAKLAVEVLTNFYTPRVQRGTVVDLDSTPLSDVRVTSSEKSVLTTDGQFALPFINNEGDVVFTKPGYHSKTTQFAELADEQVVVLEQERQSLWLKIIRYFTRVWKTIF